MPLIIQLLSRTWLKVHGLQVKQLPRILCLHLKRFKYIEQYDRYTYVFRAPSHIDQQSSFNTMSEDQAGCRDMRAAHAAMHTLLH